MANFNTRPAIGDIYPKYTTAELSGLNPTENSKLVRVFNITNDRFEVYNGTSWVEDSGGGSVNEGFGSHDDGVVLLGIDTSNKGTIGTNAIDSSQTTISGRGSTGDYSHAEGGNTHAEGENSHAEGYGSHANKTGSHAEGYGSHAEGNYSHAEGYNTHTEGFGSHAEGENTHAEGSYSHAEGHSSHAEGQYSHVEGEDTHAEGENSHAEGLKTNALGDNCKSSGERTLTGPAVKVVNTPTGNPSNIELSGDYSSDYFITSNDLKCILEDGSIYTIVATNFNSCSYVNPITTLVINEDLNSYDLNFVVPNHSNAQIKNANSSGHLTIASGENSHTEGERTQTIGRNSHAEGYGTIASGWHSHAEGGYRTSGESPWLTYIETIASGEYSHAEGRGTQATGLSSHAEGENTHAEGENTHAEGYVTHAEGENSHAEGGNTHAEGENSHAEGYFTHAEGENSHAEGYFTHAEGQGSHAEGRSSHAEGDYSHAKGKGSKTTHKTEQALSSGSFSSPGDSQQFNLVLQILTTSLVWKALKIDTFSDLIMPTNSIWNIKTEIAATESGTSLCGVFSLSGAFKFNGTDITEVGSATKDEKQDSGFNGDVRFNISGTTLEIQVHKSHYTTCRWTAHVSITQTIF